MKQEHIQRAPGAFIAVLRRDDLAFWLLALALPALFLMPVTHDEIWDLWIGRQMVHGARLYRDIAEVNPPLWFWISALVAAPGIELRATAVLLFTAATAFSLWLIPARYRLASLIALLVLPLHDFGQREHFTLIATAPYVFLIGRRSAGEPVKYPVIIGILAAIGFALKPYFAVVPLALELLAPKPFRRPEFLTIVALGLTYAAAALIATPDYVTTMIPEARAAYGAFGGGPGLVMVGFVFIVALAGALLGRRTGNPVTRALLLAALAFLPSALLQAKGWPYQTLPARGFLFLAIALELWRLQKRPIADALLLGAALSCFWPIGIYQNAFKTETERHLASIPAGSSIAAIVNNPSMAWPMVYEHKLRWALPEMSVWQLQALQRDPSVKPIAQKYVDIALARHPDALLVDIRPDQARVAYSLIPRGYLAAYRPLLRTEKLQSYVRTDLRSAKP